MSIKSLNRKLRWCTNDNLPWIRAVWKTKNRM